MLTTVGVHSIGDAVRAARKAAGLSRPEVERRAGLTPRTLERVEQRGDVPRAETLRAIAVALGTTAEALEGAEPAPLSAQVEGLVAQHGARAVLAEIVRHV